MGAFTAFTFLGLLVELNDVEASMMATLSPYVTATNQETSIVIGVVGFLALLPMFCAFAAPAIAAFVLQTIMFFLSFAPIVYVVGRNNKHYVEGEALPLQTQAVLVGASAALALLVSVWVHRSYMPKRIERTKCLGVAYPGYGALTLLSACVIAVVGTAIDAQSKQDYLRVVKSGSLSIMVIVSLVVGNLLELLLPVISVLWGVGVACPMMIATAVVALMKRSECPSVVDVASDMMNYQIPTPITIPLDEGQTQCARAGVYVAGGCAAAGAVAMLVQLFMYCCVVRPRAAKAKAADELAAAIADGGANNVTFNLTVNEAAGEAVPLLGSGASYPVASYTGYSSDIAVGTPIVVACE